MSETETQPPAGPPNRLRLSFLVWAAIFPLLTLLLLVLNPILEGTPLPVRTGVATAILVPIVVMWIIPFVMSRFANWLSG